VSGHAPAIPGTVHVVDDDLAFRKAIVRSNENW
jgi:hypothetical protein